MIAAEFAAFVDVVELTDLHHVAAIFQTARHAARADLETGRVGDDRLLETDLGAVGEARHHRRILPPFFGKALLRGGVAIRILQTLHVADHPRSQTETLHPAKQIHLRARLVAVACRQDDTVFRGIGLENRTDRGVDLGIQQHDILAVLERLQRHPRAELDRAGRVDQHVDQARSCEQERILGDHRPLRRDRVVESALRIRERRRPDSPNI